MKEFMFISIALLSVLVVSLIWRVLDWIWWAPKKIERQLKEQGIKGTPYKLLFGEMKEFIRLMKEARSKPIKLSHDIVSRAIPFTHQTIQNYGKMSMNWFGTSPTVNIMDPNLISDILSNKVGHFGKPKFDPLFKLLVSGILTYEGEKWVRHRRIVNRAFHLEKLKLMIPAFYTSCNELVSRWEKLVTSRESCELDVWSEFKNLTGDIISRTAFGSSFEEGRQIFLLQNEQAELLIQSQQYGLIPGYRFLPTKRNNRMKEINREVRSLLRGIINKREKALNIGEASNNDLLGMLMESNYNDIQEHGNSKNMRLSIEDIIEECKLFYFAGHETTATLLAWTMVVLSMHPDWQVHAREEVMHVFGNSEPNFDGLNYLKMVTMILHEVLRLYPSVAQIIRSTNKSTKLGKISLPPGVQLVIPTILVHHDRELWGEDAQEFKPERFKGGISKATKNQVSFFPFGWGPRICVGQNFAMTEAKMAIAMILQRFSFDLSPSYAHAPHTIITLQPQYGVQIRLHKL